MKKSHIQLLCSDVIIFGLISWWVPVFLCTLWSGWCFNFVWQSNANCGFYRSYFMQYRGIRSVNYEHIDAHPPTHIHKTIALSNAATGTITHIAKNLYIFILQSVTRNRIYQSICRKEMAKDKQNNTGNMHVCPLCDRLLFFFPTATHPAATAPSLFELF